MDESCLHVCITSVTRCSRCNDMFIIVGGIICKMLTYLYVPWNGQRYLLISLALMFPLWAPSCYGKSGEDPRRCSSQASCLLRWRLKFRKVIFVTGMSRMFLYLNLGRVTCRTYFVICALYKRLYSKNVIKWLCRLVEALDRTRNIKIWWYWKMIVCRNLLKCSMYGS